MTVTNDFARSREFAGLFLPDRQGSQPPTLVQAVVASVTDGVVSLYLSGDQAFAIGGIRYLDSYQPVVDDVVWCLKNGPDILVIGRLRPTAQEFYNLVAGTGSFDGNVTVDGSVTVAGQSNLDGNIDIQGNPTASSKYSGGKVAQFTRGSATGGMASGAVYGNTNAYTYISGRQYVAELVLPWFIIAVANVHWQAELERVSDSSQMGRWRHAYTITNGVNSHNPAYYFTQSGSAQFRVRFNRIGGSGAADAQALGSTPAIGLYIHDCGPT